MPVHIKPVFSHEPVNLFVKYVPNVSTADIESCLTTISSSSSYSSSSPLTQPASFVILL